jgi:DnaJ-like protein
MTDLYRTLGVSPGATSAEIKSAYKRLARRYHPDVSHSPDANAQFARINEAYHILISPRLRSAYDSGQYVEQERTFYASRAAEIVAIQREFDRIHDEDLASFRQETAARTHAVMVVVPLFLSTFYVMLVKPTIIQQLNMLGRIVIIALAIYGLIYLIKNLSLVLRRYTYEMPDQLTSVFRHEAPHDKAISRRAGLVFLVCGYLVSLGLGYIVSKLLPMHGRLSPSMVLGVLLYPPIAVLIIGSLRRIAGFLDRA